MLGRTGIWGVRRVLACGVVSASLVVVGCGGGNEIDVTIEPLDLDAVPATLGPGPWEKEDVENFVRPAFNAIADVEGELSVLSCTESWSVPVFSNDPGQFTCLAYFSGGGTNTRQLKFASNGKLESDTDVTPDTQNLGNSSACTSRPEVLEDLPDCDVVPDRYAETQVVDPDTDLYGTANGPSVREGQPGNPRDCPEANGESVQAVRISCADALEVAERVTPLDRCAPSPDDSEKHCRVAPFDCFGTANIDSANPWSFRCSVFEKGQEVTGYLKEENENNPYVSFYVPPS